tara:strand:+ start:133 stop:1104 length:972 start_codon:yes stop_codon:yes gene_type:complete
MKTIEWENSKLSTSKLGFGCAPIMGRVGKKKSLYALDMSYELGVRHFDIARSYGFGEAEGVLGQFIRQKRDTLTITTKFGINPPKNQKVLSKIKPLARMILENFPNLRSKIPYNSLTTITSGFFSKEYAKKSLEKSLRELKTDYVDLLMLHDCNSMSDLSEDLLTFMELLINEGKIKDWGLATELKTIEELLPVLDIKPGVIQYESNIWCSRELLNNDLLNINSILHSPFGGVKRSSLAHELCSNNSIISWGEKENLEISFKKISNYFLEAAILLSNNGIVLCSMFNKTHIHSNVKAFNSPNLSSRQVKEFIKICNLLNNNSS